MIWSTYGMKWYDYSLRFVKHVCKLFNIHTLLYWATLMRFTWWNATNTMVHKSMRAVIIAQISARCDVQRLVKDLQKLWQQWCILESQKSRDFPWYLRASFYKHTQPSESLTYHTCKEYITCARHIFTHPWSLVIGCTALCSITLPFAVPRALGLV